MDPSFSCGLDGNWAAAGLGDWLPSAERLTNVMSGIFEGNVRKFGILPAFNLNLDGETTPWILVRHPLWNFGDNTMSDTILHDAVLECRKSQETIFCVDTFNLTRRKVKVREWIKSEFQNRR